jgi:tetratricopeptide (TPR) repeat protein
LYALGELPSALAHLEQTITLYDPQTHPRHTAGTADPRVNCLSYAAWTLWVLGYPDQAVERNQQALTLATELAHPFSLAYALWMAAWVRLFRREARLACERAEAAITLSTEQAFPYGVRVATLVRDLALVEQGQAKEGIPQVQQRFMPFVVALEAEAYGKVGQVKKGLTSLAEALALVDKTGERCFEAEIYRLKGTLTLQSQVPSPKSKIEAEAEVCFLKAIDIACKQQAKSLELRAVMSLVRLRQLQVTQDASRSTQHAARLKLAQAHEMLSEVYHWFTKGFATRDLQEAKTLLDSLESQKV